jgi:hypothetical protein
MAQAMFSTGIYGANGNDWNNSNGVTMAFSPTQVVLRALPYGSSYSGVTCLTQIQLLPTAPSPIQPVYYSADTITTLLGK